ncbi:MAG: hypothetical protein IT178_08030 [Acidobacteria bacterium]|nr:hypothetical protein [Acidobacteriota bacterium]
MLLRPGATSSLAVRLREGTLTLGEAFSFMSGLYFRGKLAYARAFAPDRTLVITPTRGLLPPDTLVDIAVIQEFATVDIADGGNRFSAPLRRDVEALLERAGSSARFVLLGSIATGKYVDVLAPALGPRLHYPIDFIGRGDMSRGGLLLRSAASGDALSYVPLDATAPRRGTRPAKLPPLPRRGVLS